MYEGVRRCMGVCQCVPLSAAVYVPVYGTECVTVHVTVGVTVCVCRCMLLCVAAYVLFI